MPWFRTELAYRAGVWIVALEGELDIATAPDAAAVMALVGMPGNIVIADLTGLTFMDSTGIHLALEYSKQAARRGFDFYLVPGHGPATRLLELVGLADQFPTLGSVDELAPEDPDSEHAVIATDLDLRTIAWNAQAERLYGWRTDEAIGRPIMDLLVPRDAQPLGETAINDIHASGDWHGEFLLRHRDGSTILVNAHDRLITNENDQPIAIVGTSTRARALSPAY